MSEFWVKFTRYVPDRLINNKLALISIKLLHWSVEMLVNHDDGVFKIFCVSHFGIFTRGQFWPSGIVVACVCVCVCMCVCVSVCPSIMSLSVR